MFNTTSEQPSIGHHFLQRRKSVYRFTSSFQLIAIRQRNHASFAQSIMHAKPFTLKYVTHNIKYEPIALQENTCCCFASGLVLSKGFPVLGVTLDAKIVDFGCSVYFCLAEVKCPRTKFHATPLNTCSNPTFFMVEISENKCITGAKWCDFIVYTSKICMFKEWHLMLSFGKSSGVNYWTIILNIFLVLQQKKYEVSLINYLLTIVRVCL